MIRWFRVAGGEQCSTSIWWKNLWPALLCAGLLLGACSDDEDPAQGDVGGEDVHEEPGDVEEPDDVEADAGDEEGPRPVVELDLDEVAGPPGQGWVRAVQAADTDDLIEGEVAQGKEGDFLLENEHGRYLVGFGDRAIGPCSWDGNLIDVERVEDGERIGSVLGEICLLFNVVQTFRPEWAEVVEDGSEGRAVVQVTGTVAPLDFLNLRAMLSDIAPGLYSLLDIDPDRPLPLSVTVYYVLHPEEGSLRVVTGIRNEGEGTEYFNLAHLVLAGSTGNYFNPLGSRQGWGYASLGVGSLDADPVSFLGNFSGHAGYAVVPDPRDNLAERLPVGAGMLAVSGAAGLLHGATDIIGTLMVKEEELPEAEGYMGLEPGEVGMVGIRVYPSDGSVSTVSDQIFADLEVATGRITGRVVDHGGDPQAGVRVTALEDGERSFTMSRTDDEGQFAMDVPLGTWQLRARDAGRVTVVDDVEVQADVELADIELAQPATVEVRVRTPAGEPTPARVIVECVGGCGILREDSREKDPLSAPPHGWLQIVELGIDGETTLALAEGAYEISVNRGMTWTTYPQDLTTAGGQRFDVEAGESYELNAEIAQVVDTTGMLGADFHVHAQASPDSATSDRERVLDFLAGGLDVMVSSDHDAVVDFAPVIESLEAGAHITSIVGNEITSSNLGHINAFPLEIDETARRGGPLDWSRDGGPHLTLQEVIDATRQHPGEQVIQLNHPRTPMGTIGLFQVDPLTGQSFAEPQTLRMPEIEADPVTGDTGLWSEEFDAIEVINGFSLSTFWGYFRWWIVMVGRGFSPTATAVSDTHGVYHSLGASPRSFVLVDDAYDTPATMNVEHFVERVKAGALVGTNGPVMRVEVVNDDGEVAGIGDVLDATAGSATARVTLEMPEWITVNRLDLYRDIGADAVSVVPGRHTGSSLEPTQSVDVVWDLEEHRHLVASGDLEHHVLRQTIEVPLEVDGDSYVVFVARGIDAPTMIPVIADSAAPLAFSNPVFLDGDGGGYDNPPLAGARAEQMGLSLLKRGPIEPAAEVIIGPDDEITPERLGRLLEALTCDHGGLEGGLGHHHHGSQQEHHHHHGQHHHHGHHH